MTEYRKLQTSAFNAVKYQIVHHTKLDHVLILDKAFKSAWFDLERLNQELKRKSDIAKTAISLIYGKEEYVYKLQNIVKDVFEKLNSNLKIYAFEYPYYDKKYKEVDSVFASTKISVPDSITFHKAFFNTEETPLEDKGSILIHEIAHLVGLTSDRETKAINSAECLRNFLLLCTEKVTQDELFLSEEEAKAQDKKQDDPPKKIATRRGEHLYNPDQPRVPAGSPNGGQWTSDGSNGGGSSKDDEKSTSSKSEKQSSSHKDTSNTNNAESASLNNQATPQEIKDGKAIIDNVRKYVGSKDWAFLTKKSKFPEKTNKCNLFVGEMLEENGYDVPLINKKWGIFPRHQPVANQWGDKELEIEGYKIVSEAIAGDIIAFKRKDPKQSGHVGIVSGDGIYISAGPETINEKAYYNYNSSGYRGKYSDRVFRRPIKK